MSESNVFIPDVSAEDMRSAITILEDIRFLVGPELLRKEITKAILHLKHGLATREACPKVLSSAKGEKEFEQDLIPKKYLIRLIGTEDYYSVFAPCGTIKASATRLSKQGAELFVKRSIARNNGKIKVEIVEERNHE